MKIGNFIPYFRIYSYVIRFKYDKNLIAGRLNDTVENIGDNLPAIPPFSFGQFDFGWAFRSLIITFFLSISVSLLTELLLAKAEIYLSFLLLMVIIAVNVAFDIFGIAVTYCSPIQLDIINYGGKSNRKRIARKLLENSEKVSNVCADIIGDICGIISGGLGISIIIEINRFYQGFDSVITSILFSSTIASLTVSGKALGKKFAMRNCRRIVIFMAEIISFFYRKKIKEKVVRKKKASDENRRRTQERCL